MLKIRFWPGLLVFWWHRIDEVHGYFVRGYIFGRAIQNRVSFFPRRVGWWRQTMAKSDRALIANCLLQSRFPIGIFVLSER